jgi:hypothetical protein
MHLGEQIGSVLSGAFEFLVGVEQDGRVTLRVGEGLATSSVSPRRAEALKHTFELDTVTLLFRPA